jgi:hypothetical protein
MGGNRPDGLKLYNFVDNHDVERIYTKLNNKAHFAPVHILEYTLPGIPSIYYGSEFGIEGKKEKFSDASLRPALNLEDYKDALKGNSCTRLIAALGKVRQSCKALSYGDYKELLLLNRQYAFSRNYNGDSVIITVNNDDSDYTMTLPAGNAAEYVGALTDERVSVDNGNIVVNVKANSGDIWLPVKEKGGQPEDTVAAVLTPTPIADTKTTDEKTEGTETPTNVSEAEVTEAPNSETSEATTPEEATSEATATEATVSNTAEAASAQSDNTASPETGSVFDAEQLAFEKGKIAGLQEAILAIMEKNGPVTDQMRKDVTDNVYHDSLINWVKSFR